MNKLCLVRQAPRLGRAGHTTPSCGSHPLQRHQPADVVGKVLQADFSLRPRDADRPYDSATRRGLLSTEHVLDAGPNSALLAVRVLLLLRERMIAVRALMKPAAQAPQAELRLGLRRAIRAVRVHIRRGVGLVQKSIEFLAVMHTRVGRPERPPQTDSRS